MGGESVEPVQPNGQPSAAKGAEAANRYAITSLVLGVSLVVLFVAFVIGFVGSLDEVELDAWTPILFVITLVTAILGCIYGVMGRSLAEDSSVRAKATIGMVISTIFLVVLIVGVVVAMIILSVVASHDSL